jgi:hypothetical protein
MAMMVYRGVQSPATKGVRGVASYTDSLPAAIIWSSVPPDFWNRRDAYFLPTSSVYFAKLAAAKILTLSKFNYESFGNTLKALKYGRKGGMTEQEALATLTYLHKRVTRQARGGEFRYDLVDEEGEPVRDSHIPLSFSDPITVISEFADDLDWASSFEVADRLTADTFIFADAPAVQKAAIRMGYEALAYPDVFDGAEKASRTLLGLEVDDLEGVERAYDIDGERVPTHRTFRPLIQEALEPVETVLTRVLLEKMDRAELTKK